MALGIYHVTCSVDGERTVIGVCADGKTDAARIASARVIDAGYERFIHIGTERICAVPAPSRTHGAWGPGQTVWY
jgi:hypothetical protein